MIQLSKCSHVAEKVADSGPTLREVRMISQDVQGGAEMHLIKCKPCVEPRAETTDCSCRGDLAARNFSDKSKQITIPAFLMPSRNSCNDCSVLASQTGVRGEKCRSCKFGGPFLGASAQSSSCQSPTVLPVSAKFNFSLTNHTFAKSSYCAHSQRSGHQSPCSLQSAAIWTPAPNR